MTGRRGSFVLLVAVLAVALWAGSAQAQTTCYPPSESCGSGTLGSTSVGGGGKVAFSGSGFKAFSEVKIYIAGKLVTTTTADASGKFSLTVTVPEGTSAGSTLIEAKGIAPSGAARNVQAALTITGAVTAPPKTGGTPSKGLSAGAIAGIAVGALALLFLVILLARPRSRTDA